MRYGRLLRAEEEWARTLMARALGVPVVQHDDNTQDAMYDLNILYPERPPGATEVVAAADPESIAFWRALDDGKRWIDPSLEGGWAVSVLPSTRVKKLRRVLPSFLSSLEAAGVRRIDDHAVPNVRTRQVARALGVVSAYQGGTDFPGSIYVVPELPFERTGGWVAETGDALATWLGGFLASSKCADVRQKLATSGATERHAFVFFPGLDSDAPFDVTDLLVRDGAPLPLIDPQLPDEITHVWAASSWATGLCFRWSPGGGWAASDKPPESRSATQP